MKINIKATEEHIEVSCTEGGRSSDFITAAGTIINMLSKIAIHEFDLKPPVSCSNYNNFCISVASWLCKSGQDANVETSETYIPISKGENRNGN